MSANPLAASMAVVLAAAGLALAQSEQTFAGSVRGWQDGAAEVVLLSPRDVPPPFVRPADAPTIGQVDEDGVFSLTLPSPETLPLEGSVPVAEYLDPACSNAELAPSDAVYFPLAYGVYRSDGSLIGEIFRGSPGAGAGPRPGEYSTLPGYAERPFTIRGACPDASRPVVEDYDFSVDAGWHEIVQSFEEHPEETGWRIDRWRNEPVPDDAIWVIIRPPR